MFVCIYEGFLTLFILDASSILKLNDTVGYRKLAGLVMAIFGDPFIPAKWKTIC